MAAKSFINFVVFRLIVSRSKGCLKLIVESKIFSLADQADDTSSSLSWRWVTILLIFQLLSLVQLLILRSPAHVSSNLPVYALASLHDAGASALLTPTLPPLWTPYQIPLALAPPTAQFRNLTIPLPAAPISSCSSSNLHAHLFSSNQLLFSPWLWLRFSETSKYPVIYPLKLNLHRLCFNWKPKKWIKFTRNSIQNHLTFCGRVRICLWPPTPTVRNCPLSADPTSSLLWSWRTLWMPPLVSMKMYYEISCFIIIF